MAYIGSKPANKAVVASDLDPAVITGQTALAVAPAATDEFIISDAGVLKRLDASLVGKGKVLQVVSATKTDSFNTTSTSYVDITGFTASITPSATTSKILIISNWMYGTDNAPYPRFTLVRDSTEINIGNAVGSSSRVSVGNNSDPGHTEDNIVNEQLSHNYLDSPSSTSSLTYKWQVKSFQTSRSIYIGQAEDTSDANRMAAPSNITLMEIGA